MLRIREEFKSLGIELKWLADAERVIKVFSSLPKGTLSGT